MKDKFKKIFFIILLFATLGIWFANGWVFGESRGYKQGQIDAINGKIVYEVKYDSTYVKIDVQK